MMPFNWCPGDTECARAAWAYNGLVFLVKYVSSTNLSHTGDTELGILSGKWPMHAVSIGD